MVERMPAKAIKGIESALELKLAYAQSTAKIVELELLQGEKGASASPQQAVGQIVQRLREELEQTRAENEQIGRAHV